MTISALLFDKDGTLFDFTATWGHWTEALIRDLARGDADLSSRLEDALGFDIARRVFDTDSPVIAQTTGEVAGIIAPLVGASDVVALAGTLNALSRNTPQVPAVALRPCLSDLHARGLRLGLATNDGEASARAHLERAGVIDLFDFVAGYDSGFGAKPEPGPLLAFARQVGVAPAQVAMVGDSPHDMMAARAAGMRRLAVLTGPTPRALLDPIADVVLPDIGAIGSWLNTQGH